MEDYTDYVERPSEETFAKLHKLVLEQRAAEAGVEDAEAALKQAKEALAAVAEVAIPELMDKMGLETFKTIEGLEVEVKENIRANISQERAPAAFTWLREHGHENLIRRVIVAEFAPGKEIEADALTSFMEEGEIQHLDVDKVHPSTLSAFVAEKLREGEDIPTDLFGVFRQRVSVVKEPRVKKAKAKAKA